MKLLLHICCAPCSVACVKSLRAEDIEPTGYWYNPNIHPFTEYRMRRETLIGYAESIGLALELNDEYGLRAFTHAVANDIAGRCRVCYAARMRETARYAAEHGYTHFSSTLLISPYQKHDLLRAAAEDAALEFGVRFLYRDFRPLYREGQEEARALGLYIQKYCGCVYSEEERYSKRFRKLAAKTAANAGLADVCAEDARARERESLHRAGLAFEAAKAAEDAALSGNAGILEAPRAGDPKPAPLWQTSLPRTLVMDLARQTERALWEVRNVIRCLADSGLWEQPYCGVPAWRHVYHMLHSLDRWYANPARFDEPDLHVEGLNDLEQAVDTPVRRPDEMETYLADISDKIHGYLATLNDGMLAGLPVDCELDRLTLIVGQTRHLHTHMGMLMGFIVAGRGEWPDVLGTVKPLPAEDDGKPHYC